MHMKTCSGVYTDNSNVTSDWYNEIIQLCQNDQMKNEN